jgi:hypothetical protein
MKGGISNVWFDRFKISNDCPEHLESIDGMCQVLTDLIGDEVKGGIQKNRILLGKAFKCWSFVLSHWSLTHHILLRTLFRSPCMSTDSFRVLDYIHMKTLKNIAVRNNCPWNF